jgi:hypothetical protein
MIAKVHDLPRADQRLTLRKVAEVLGISLGSCQVVLNERFGHEICVREIFPIATDTQTEEAPPVYSL